MINSEKQPSLLQWVVRESTPSFLLLGILEIELETTTKKTQKKGNKTKQMDNIFMFIK